MSSPPDPAAGSESPADGPSTVQLPPELWKKVIVNLRNDDLKRARFVNSTWNEFAIKPLFRSVCFSVVPENQARIVSLSKNKKLSQRVEQLYLDTSSYAPSWPSQTYAQSMSNGFADALGVPRELFKDGPLSSANLLKVLRMDPSLSLGEGYLSGKPRTQFLSGYGQYCGRGDFEMEKVRSDGIYKSLAKLLPLLTNLRHVETVTSWTRAEDHRQKLESYLYHNLPEATFKLIPGLREYSIPRINYEPKFYGRWVAPGISARRLNFMCAESLSSLCYGQEKVHEIVSAALRALQDSKIQLESLSLPGSDRIGFKPDPKDRDGMVTIPPLTTVLREQGGPEKTLLLPLFEHLKVLELQIDHSHPGTRYMSRYHYEWNRLPRALQGLKNVVSLSIGYKILPTGSGLPDLEPPTLYETMLFQDKDTEAMDEDDDQNDHVSAPCGGLVFATNKSCEGC